MTLTAHAQESKTITVNGSAEKLVIPDEIYLAVSVQEYNDGSRKVDIQSLETDLVRAVTEVGLAESNIQLDNVSGYGSYTYQPSQAFLATKSYLIKLNTMKQMEDFLFKLEQVNITSLGINSLSYSKTEETIASLKAAAVKQAMENAKTLAEQFGKSIGEVTQVTEARDYNNYYYPGGSPTVVGKNLDTFEAETGKTLTVRPIILSYGVQATFSLK